MVSVSSARRTRVDQPTASRKRSLSTMGVSTPSSPTTRRRSREYSGPETRSHTKGGTASDGEENDCRAKVDVKVTAHKQATATPGKSVLPWRTKRQRLGSILTPVNRLPASHSRTPEPASGVANSSTSACTVWPCEEEIASHSVTWQKMASPMVDLTPADERRERMLRRRLKRESGLGMGSRDHHSPKEPSPEGAKRARRSSVPKGKQSSCKKQSKPVGEERPASRRRRGVPDAEAKCPRAKSESPPASSSVSSEADKIKPATDDRNGHGPPSAPVMNWWRNQRLGHRPTCRMKLAESGASTDDAESSWKFVAPPTAVSAQLGQPGIRVDRRDSKSKVEGRSDDEDIAWTESQLRSLRCAQIDTDPSAKNFWDVVASRVEGKTRGECQRKWFREFISPGLPRKRRPPRKPAEKRASSSRAGSLQSNQGNGVSTTVAEAIPREDRADDLFQATPLRGFERFPMKEEQISGGDDAAWSGPGNVEGFQTNEAEGHADGGGVPETKRRRANKTYVQAVSKRMHKVAGMAAKGRCKQGQGSVGRGVCHGVSSSSSSTARQFHKISASDRGSMKASLSASGTVCVTFKGAASDDWSEDKGLGLSDAASDQSSSGSDSES